MIQFVLYPLQPELYFSCKKCFVLLKLESSAFAFVCFEISTLLKLENSCLLLFSEGLKFQALEGLKFQALEGLKSNVKTDDSSLWGLFLWTKWHADKNGINVKIHWSLGRKFRITKYSSISCQKIGKRKFMTFPLHQLKPNSKTQ